MGQPQAAVDDVADGLGDWVDREGIRFINPEILLLFKARQVLFQARQVLFQARRARSKDEADFSAIVPLLNEDQLTWLRDTLARVHPGHTWLARLG